MVGQSRLLSKVENLTLDSLPRSLLLKGSKGCGRHLLCSQIACKLNISISDITDKLNSSQLEEIQLCVEPILYIIDVSSITLREQNVILKFVEEPSQNSYIVLLCESESQLLQTLRSRCCQWEFEKYSERELKEFYPTLEDEYFSIFRTPGELTALQGVSLEPYKEFALKVLDKIAVATLPNTLSISDKLAFKNEKGKLAADVFIKILCFYYKKSVGDLKLLDLISSYERSSLIPNVNQKVLFENFLIKLWRFYRVDY